MSRIPGTALLLSSLLFGSLALAKDPAPAKTPAPATTASAAQKADPNAKPAAAAPPAELTSDQKVRAALGTKKDGWVPKRFAKLKRNMTPEQADAILSGAADMSEFGFAEVSIGDLPGVSNVKLYFGADPKGKRQLKSLTIRFEKGFEFTTLLGACSDKYGKGKALESNKHIVTWSGPRFSIAQLHESLDDDAEFELELWL